MPCDRAIDLQFPGQPIWAQRAYEIPASVPSTELNPILRSVDTHGPGTLYSSAFLHGQMSFNKSGRCITVLHKLFSFPFPFPLTPIPIPGVPHQSGEAPGLWISFYY